VRKGNPTITTVATSLGGFPPAISTAAQGVIAAPGVTEAGPPSFSLPGEGVAMQTAAGSVAQLWNLGFIWAEA
jgi:hypothetical protein